MTHRHGPNCCVKARPRDLAKALPGAVLRPTWLRPVAKAGPEDEPEFKWLHDIADSAAPEVRRRFLEAIKSIRGTVKEAKLRAALETGNVDAVMRVLGLDRDLGAIEPGLLKPLEATVHEAGAAALDATPAIANATRGGQLALRFDAVNPHTVQSVRTYGFNLIRQVTDDTRDGIRAIVSNALEFGGHPAEQARQIRSLIGLTENQADAVANFRRLLVSRDRGALDRALRDRRFDGTLRRVISDPAADALSDEQIDRMVERYASRMLDFRATNIARTESINAARLGTQGAWVQATENGLLVRSKVRQGWMVTPDDRLCIYCAEVPLLNPEGVRLGEQFQTALGPVDGPTLHPNCFPGDTLVSSSSEIRAVTSRWYDGYLVVCRTSGGDEISCTPNHPILTDRGWVAAKLLTESDNLIRNSGKDWLVSSGTHNKNAPATIKEIAKSFGRARHVSATPVPVAAKDFHGDGEGSKVAIVRTNGLLRHNRHTPIFQKGKQFAFAAPDIARSIFRHGRRILDAGFETLGNSLGGGMCTGHLRLALADGHAAPLEGFGRRSPPRIDAVLPQNPVDDVARDVELARHLQDGGAGPVERQKIVEIRRKPFSGHVYNLETAEGWYRANGLVVHNCRCIVYLLAF
jgi:hypothetical protein